MNRNVDIIVSGHLCLDLIPRMEHVPLSSLSSPGRLFEVGAMDVSTGGAVSNTGLALHRLGVSVRLMATVGGDMLGRATVEFLNARDPALSQLITVQPELSSSYTIVLAPQKVDRIFLHANGPNAVFGIANIDFSLIAQAKIFHLGYPTLLPRLIADEGAELEELYRRAKSAGVLTSMDLTLPDPNSQSGQADWPTILRRTLPYVDVFVPSIEEILFMLRRADYDAWRGDILAHLSADYLDTLATDLLEMGPAIVGFKLGALGFYVRGSRPSRLNRLVLNRLVRLPLRAEAWANARAWHPAFQVHVVGTTGAGDSAYAGFLAALLRGMGPQDAIRWACAVGACNVEAADATSGVRTWDETQARLDAGWPTLDLRLPGL